MGNDGGSIPRRIELVKEKKKATIQNPDIERKAVWFFCALSKNPLLAPIAACALGKLYNQDAIIEYLLDKTAYGDGDQICAHVTSMKDITKLNLTENPAFDESRENNEKSTVGSLEQESVSRYICPISMKEMNGKHRFVYLETCGCVFSEQALKQVPGSECLTCGTPFTAENVITINPTDKKEIETMKHNMEEKKVKAKAERKAKKAEKKAINGSGDLENGTKRKLKDVTDLPAAKKMTTMIAPSSATAAVVNKVKEELEARNKQQKSSAAIQSIYRKKGEEKKQTYLSTGTFTRPIKEDRHPEDDELNIDTEEDRQVAEAVIVQKPEPNWFELETDDEEDEDEVPHDEDDESTPYDDSYLDKEDKELMAITEKNRHIDYEKPADENKKHASEKYRPEVLVCQEPEIVRQEDRITTTLRYGYVDKASMPDILPGPPRRVRTYLIMCDFSDESFHAMEWAMGTMLRNNDELHILTVINKDDEMGSTEDIQKQLGKAAAHSTSKAKKTIEKMLLYNIRITTHVIYGKIKETLLMMIDDLDLTMVVCGSRGRSPLKGFIMGSISSFLVHNASVPVSVVRDHKTASQRKRRPSAARKLSQSMQSGELKVDEAA
ncbi:unnamed protein product [Umbelopsis vinacea]